MRFVEGLESAMRFAIGRPRLIGLACVTFLLWAGLEVRQLPLDFMPDTAPAEFTLRTNAPGLVAEQVENLVSHPLETALVGASGVARVHSDSLQGLSTVTVGFTPGLDPQRARATLIERLATLAATLPKGVSTPQILPLEPTDAVVLKVGFTSDSADAMALRDAIAWEVRPRLLATPGVAEVVLFGGATRRYEVQARPGDLSDSDLGFLDILNAVRRTTSVAGAGFIDTDSQRVLIDPRGQPLTPEDVGAGQIQNPGAAPVRISDVADVVEAPAPATGDALIDGKPGVLVVVKRQFQANGVETTRALETRLADLAPVLRAHGISLRPDLDRPATFADMAVRGVASDLLLGVGLLAVALMVFFRDLRAVVITLIAIPLSFLAATVALRAFGWSLNAMTLGGMVLGLGVVIDDALIDVENIRWRLGVAEGRDAPHLLTVLRAALEVRGPVIIAALAFLLTAAPLLAIDGPQASLVAPLAVSALAATCASLIVSVLVTPALCNLLLQHIKPKPAAVSPWRARFTHVASQVSEAPWPMLGVAAALTVLALGGLCLDRFEDVPSIADSHILIDAQAPAATSISSMVDYGVRLTRALAPLPGVRAVSERVGRDETGGAAFGVEHAVFDLALDPGLGTQRQRDLAETLRARLKAFPGLITDVQTRFDAGHGRERAPASVRIVISGLDLDGLEARADQLALALRSLPGAKAVQVEKAARAPAVRVDVNFQRLALYGLSTADVLDTVQAAFAGEEVGQIYRDGRAIGLAVSGQPSLRRDPEAVGQLLLRSASGFSVRLSSVANVYLTEERAVIAHDGALRRVIISANPDHSDAFVAAARRVIAAHAADLRGAVVEVSREDQANSEAKARLALSYGLALLAVGALLSLAFDGRTAAILLACAAFSFVGASAVVFLMGGVLTLGASVGLIAVFGLSLRGAILIIGRLEDLVLSGRQALSSATIAKAAGERALPVLMTTALVALAVAPVALRLDAPGHEVVGPMALVILGGLVSGAVGALVLLPALIKVFWRPGYARLARRS